MVRKLQPVKREFWWEMAKNEFYAPMYEEVREAAERYLTEPVEELRASDFERFYTDNNRVVYEKAYFARRGRLNAYVLMTLTTGREKYLRALVNIIEIICNEPTWALPAHCGKDDTPAERKTTLDLFNAETGFALAEAASLLAADLPVRIIKLIKEEVHERIINSFLNIRKDNWWEHATHNWAAVCAGGIGHCFLYLADEDEIELAMPRILNALSTYLNGFYKDGACLEGYAYWTYGFGFFLEIAETLRIYTKGKTNLLKDDKINAIARFQQYSVLGQSCALTVSDAPSAQFAHEIGLSHYIYKNFKDVVLPRYEDRAHFGYDSCYRFATFIRNFIWTDPSLKDSGGFELHYFDNAEWLLVNRKSFSAFVKCGTNHEPHNHNDIGHISVVMNNQYTLCDLGSGEYVNGYFDDRTRYGFLVNSSRSHSVPIINGHYQTAGMDSEGRVLEYAACSEWCRVKMDLRRAYDDEKLEKLTRRVVINTEDIELTDEFEMTEKSNITERFVSKIEPDVADNTVSVASTQLMVTCDAALWNVRISDEIYMNHEGNEERVYFIDYLYCPPYSNIDENNKTCRFELKISPLSI